MATLNSPGVSVTVIDESFYLPAAPGTVPLLIVASQANKMNSAGTGIAPGTLPANAGTVYLLTSQQDLGNTFGIPYFQTDAENNPINASEVNEYGLQAAYSFLGVSNRAYVVRANVDTSQLIGNANIPTSPPADQTAWFDIADTNFGIFQWNSSTGTSGQTFTNQGSINNLMYLTNTALMTNDGNYTPLSSFGSLGDYVLTGNSANTTTIIKLWFKKYQTSTPAGTWVEVGSSAWQASWPTITATSATSSWTSGSVSLTINGSSAIGASSTSPTTLATAINGAAITGVTAAVINGYLQIYSNGTTSGSSGGNAGGITISNSSGTGLTILGITAGNYLPPALQMSPHYSVPQFGTYQQTNFVNGYPTGSVWVKTTSVNQGANYFVKKYNAATSSWVVQAVQLFPNGQSALATLDPTGGGINLPIGTTYVKYNDSEAGSTSGLTVSGGYFRTKLYTRAGVGATTITSNVISNATFDGSPLTASAYGIISNGSGTTSGNVFTPTGTITGTYTAGMVLSGTGVTTGTSISSVNTATAITATFLNNTLSGVSITGTAGQFSCTTTGLYTGMQVTISGTLGGTGSITGYANPTTYVISATNGTTTFTLTTLSGSAIVTTTGTPTGLTYTLTNVLNVTAVTGTISRGMLLSGTSVTTGSYIQAFGSGAGGTGTYLLNQTTTGTVTTATSYTVSTSQLVNTASNTITGTATSETYSFTIQESSIGSTSLTNAVPVTFNATGNALNDANALLTALQAAVNDANMVFSLSGTLTAPTITISHLAGGDIKFVDGTNTPLATIFSVGTTENFYTHPNGVANNYLSSLWSGSTFALASITSPTTAPANGTLWYNNSLENFDIMINDGSKWKGYLNYTQNAVGGTTTDPLGPIVSASKPTLNNSGSALANGDIWINTSDLEDFPNINVYNYQTKTWSRVDNTDHTSQNGIVFADARWSDQSQFVTAHTGLGAPDTIASLLTSDFVDFDCPSPALYPKGTLLFNTRRSDFNVKSYEVGYVNTQDYNTIYNANSPSLMTDYYPDRWVTKSANNTNGVAQLGRFSQRAVVLQALEETIQSNTNIRQPDTVIFNLLSCPGYIETASSLVGLNTDNGQTAFIIHDTPARLTPDATTLSNWGNNTAGATVDSQTGLIFTDPYSAVYYPWGYTTDLLGNNIVVPPSHIMLRTIALSDNVSYPWFAPAGVRRGGVTNASSVGYVDGQTGEFMTVALNSGQRDTLASIHVNPITYIAGTGLVVYGQYTRQLVASSLDRINVARLVCYLRYQLNKLAKPYIFEPNDTITRTQIKNEVTKLMVELTAERALYDYLVVCDSSNNTPARIDASELYVDIAIEPVKAVEFIYIPLRLENTGAIAGLSA